VDDGDGSCEIMAFMSRHMLAEAMNLKIGTLSRPHLLEALEREGIRTNRSAQTLLDHPVFDEPAPRSVTLVERSLRELGLEDGAALPRIFDAAEDQGLRLCPTTTGPYLRLAWLSQPNAPDTIMSTGRAPTASLTVAAYPLRADEDDYPKGFYLRVIDGQPWLRGYRCDLSYPWNPDDRLVFAIPDSAELQQD
jgi:hypothetical protein